MVSLLPLEDSLILGQDRPLTCYGRRIETKDYPNVTAIETKVFITRGTFIPQ